MLEGTALGAPAFAIVVGGIALFSWRTTRTKAAAISFVRMYERRSLPIFARNRLGLMWLWALAALLGATAVVVPRWLGQWVAVLIIGVAYVAFALSYRVPAPFLPGWLKEEIETGRTPVARPDIGDWLLFAFGTVMVALGIPATLILIIGFQ